VIEPDGADRYQDVATRVLDTLLESTPEDATLLGDHRFDDRLTDHSAAGVAARADALAGALALVDGIDDTALDGDDRVDLEILRTGVARELWHLTELRRHERDPLVHLPGDAIYPLVVRESGDPADRFCAIGARLAAIPAHLERARAVLRDMPRVCVETAIAQGRGVVALIEDDLEPVLAAHPGLRGDVDAARPAAVEAVSGFGAWLEGRLPDCDASPRLGSEAYAATLWYTLDTEIGPDVLLTRAESDLQAVEEEIAELASRIEGRPPRPGQVRDVLDRLADRAPVTDETILSLCERALEETTQRVRELDLVSIPADPVQIIVMPESRRGVAVAYCDAPGPLENGDGGPEPTFFAVSPTPAGWPPERVASFYREYNGYLLRNLTIHEAMPGHVLQLAHSARHRGSTPVRAALQSGPFIEGWAVYAESVLAGRGIGRDSEADAALRMQQLKMQLRMTINAVLDVRVHSRGMTEAEAMELMTVRGHQEEGEAAGKWRRALLTSAQLATYYVGYHEVCDVVTRLRERRPRLTERRLHDEVLGHGSPPPRHLRTLLALTQG
jgi:uncharacterized protein (DUF885 family)